MSNQFTRIELAVGKEGIQCFKQSHIMVVGVGGVGAVAVESLVRTGIGRLTIIDNDIVDITNVNRQMQATLETVGMSKCQALINKMKTINPDVQIEMKELFLTNDNIEHIFVDEKIDYIIDAIDTISMKCALIMKAIDNKVPIISSMGMANKLDATKITIASIWETKYDPIAKVVRKKLRESGYEKYKVPVTYSEELPIIPTWDDGNNKERKVKRDFPPSSNMFVPAVSGLYCANYIVQELIKKNEILINRKK